MPSSAGVRIVWSCTTRNRRQQLWARRQAAPAAVVEATCCRSTNTSCDSWCCKTQRRFISSCSSSTTRGYHYYTDEKEIGNKPLWIAKLDRAVLRYPPSTSSSSQRKQRQPISLEIHAAGNGGGHVVLGPNASGKSLLALALSQQQQNQPGGDHAESSYVFDPDTIQHNTSKTLNGRPSVATVSFESHEQLLQEGGSVYQALTPDGGVLSKAAQFLVVRFGLYSFLTRQVHTLSTGEIRKVLLIRALSRRPLLLVLDHALDGLDAPSRQMVQELMSQTIRGFRADILVQGVDPKATAHTQVVLMTHRAPEIVDEIDRVTFLLSSQEENGGEGAVTEERQGRSGEELILAALSNVNRNGLEPWDDDKIGLPGVTDIASFWNVHSEARHSTITAGEDDNTGVHPITQNQQHDASLVHLYKFSVFTSPSDDDQSVVQPLILDLNWNVQKGQRWLVAGGNGAGKSTLSRYLAHPELARVDSRASIMSRSGATNDGSLHMTLPPSQVGWVSTERHMSVARSEILARDVLLGRPTNDEKNENSRIQEAQAVVDEKVGETVARQWLQLRHDQLSRPFYELSQGEQKMVLIASAIAKLPKLLIIDEPLQGLDLRNRRLVLGLVERLCRATDVSLVYVTHHFEELVPSISHVLHLRKGRSVYNDVIAAYNPNEF